MCLYKRWWLADSLEDRKSRKFLFLLVLEHPLNLSENTPEVLTSWAAELIPPTKPDCSLDPLQIHCQIFWQLFSCWYTLNLMNFMTDHLPGSLESMAPNLLIQPVEI